MKPDLREKLENFYYHHKLLIYSSLFILFVVVYTLISSINEKKADLYITYVGRGINDTVVEEKINKSFSESINDINNDGKKYIRIKAILTSDSYEGDMFFWQQVDVDYLKGDTYLYLVEDFLFDAMQKRGIIGSFEVDGKELNYIDISNNEYFKPENYEFSNIYLCVRNNLNSNENMNVILENGNNVIKKISEK